MKTLRTYDTPQVAENEWITFPGGELEGRRPKALCPACRAELQRAAAQAGASGTGRRANRPLCFACYRAELDRERALKAAGELNTATEARFQSTLPFEPVNRPRLERLRSARATARVSDQAGVGRYVDKRRQAQIAARHALQRIAAGLHRHDLRNGVNSANPVHRHVNFWDAVHAAELQLPESWLPFVVSQ